MNRDDRFLRLSLRGNAVFSLLSAVTLVALNGPLCKLMGIEARWLLPVIAVGLTLFAADLLRTAAGQRIGPKKAWSFVLMDGTWVIGSAGVIALGVLTPSGHWIVGGVALIVTTFALLQYAGLRRLT